MQLYKVEDLKTATFISRPNRYLSIVEMDHDKVEVHVHDPGRLKELLYPGNRCLVKHAPGLKRKTSWDMIAAKKGDEFVLVHSGYHRYLAESLLKSPEISPFGKTQEIRAEVKAGESRLDFRLVDESGEVIWIEVKGCSLSEDGVAKFPDAPTVRGVRHLKTLMDLKGKGERSAALIIVLSDSTIFEPNGATDPLFYKTFYDAINAGVEVYPVRVEFDAHTGAFIYREILPIKGV